MLRNWLGNLLWEIEYFFTHYYDAGTDLWNTEALLCFLGLLYVGWARLLWSVAGDEEGLFGKVLSAGGLALIMVGFSFIVLRPVINFVLGFLSAPFDS